jgi:hypothetical protein
MAVCHKNQISRIQREARHAKAYAEVDPEPPASTDLRKGQKAHAPYRMSSGVGISGKEANELG